MYREPLHMIHSLQDMVELVEQVGLLPMFEIGIPGFSVDACTPPELWHGEGPWEWKGPAVRTGRCLYGKFFGGKAGFVRTDLFPDFANVRRDGYDAEGFWEDGLMRHLDKVVLDEITRREKVVSLELKAACDFRKGGNKGFETVITRLQQQTFVCIGDFDYRRDRYGKPYGWGLSVYTTPEALLGEAALNECASSVEESRARLIGHIRTVLPDLTPAWEKLLIG